MSGHRKAGWMWPCLVVVILCVVTAVLWKSGDAERPEATVPADAREPERASLVAQEEEAAADMAATAPETERTAIEDLQELLARDRSDLVVRVTSTAGNAIAEASVALSRRWSQRIPTSDAGREATLLAEGTTDSSGTWQTEGVVGCSYNVAVAKDGLVSAEVDFVHGGAEINVVLGHGGRVVGQVTHLDGDGVADVTISAKKWGSERTVSTRTDRLGSYVLEQVPPGRSTLVVLSANEESVTRTVDVGNDEESRQDFVLQPPCVTMGTVVAADTKETIANAEVGDWWRKKIVRTAADGSYRLVGFPRTDRDELIVTADGFARGFARIDKGSDREKRCDVQLTRAAVIRGRVVASDGRPLPAARVTAITPSLRFKWMPAGEIVRGHDGEATEWLVAFAQSDGAFVIGTANPQKDYNLIVQSPGLGTIVTLSVPELAAGAVRDVGDIVLRRGGALRGTIRCPSGGVRNAEVILRNRLLPPVGAGLSISPDVGAATVKADGNGRFAVDDLSAGYYGVTLRIDGANLRQTEVEIGEGEVTQCDFDVTELVMVEGQTDPPAGERVDVRFVSENGEITRDALTDAKGAFVMQLPRGRYFVAAQGKSGGGKTLRCDLTAGKTSIVVPVAAPVVVRGRVLDQDGAEVARAYVSVLTSEAEGGARHVLAGTECDEQGRFSVAVPPDTIVDVAARKPAPAGGDPLMGAALASKDPNRTGMARAIGANAGEITIVIGVR